MKYLVIALVSCVSCFASADNASVRHASRIFLTNHAHRVICGTLGGLTNNTFILSGHAYPLSILPPCEQLRVKKLAHCDLRTAKEKRLDRARAMKLERIRLREQEGEIDRETADRLRRDVN